MWIRATFECSDTIIVAATYVVCERVCAFACVEVEMLCLGECLLVVVVFVSVSSLCLGWEGHALVCVHLYEGGAVFSFCIAYMFQNRPVVCILVLCSTGYSPSGKLA